MLLIDHRGPVRLPAPSSHLPWTGHEHGTSGYRRLLAALFFSGVATFAQLYAVQAVLPEVSTDLGVPASRAALLVSAATLGLAVGVIPWSQVSDRLGRVRCMTVAIVAATVLGILVPLAPTYELMLVGRVLQGIALGGIPAVAVAYLSEEVSPAHTAHAAGTYVAGNTIGGLVGRLVAGPLAQVASWRVGLVAVSVMCAACAVLFVVLAPAQRGFAPSARGAHPDGSLAHRLAANLRDRRQLARYAQGFLLMGGFVATYNYLGFRLERAPFGLSQSLVAFVFLAYLAGTWSSERAGALASQVGRLPVVIGSTVVMVAGIGLTLVDWLPGVLVGLVVMTAGFFGAHSVSSGWTAVAAPVGRAQASSLYNLLYYVGSSVFGWLGGVFFAAGGWTATAGMVGGLAVLALVVAATVLPERGGATLDAEVPAGVATAPAAPARRMA